MRDEGKRRCYLLLGEAPTEEAARKIAEVYAPCPFVYFMGAFGKTVVGIYFLTEERSWWVKAISSEPRMTLGLVRAALYVSDSPAFPVDMEPRIPERRTEISPCGAKCAECLRYQEGICPGCPASRHFQEDHGGALGSSGEVEMS